MITSGQTGWNPNPCKYAVSKNGIFGDWSTPEVFCVNDVDLHGEVATTPEEGTTFWSQSTNILPYRDKNGKKIEGKFIYMGDRWFRENLRDSRYIWLPIALDRGLVETSTMGMERFMEN